MFSTDIKMVGGCTPSSPSLPGKNKLDPVVKAYWVGRMDTNLKNIRVACADLRQTQQVRRELNADIVSLKLQQGEIDAAMQENAAAIQENAAAIQVNEAKRQANTAKRQVNAAKRQANEARKQQLQEQLAANAANLNEIQELKRAVEELQKTAELLAVRAKATFSNTDNDSDDDLEAFMANVELKVAARASEKAGASAVLV